MIHKDDLEPPQKPVKSRRKTNYKWVKVFMKESL